MAVKIHLKTGDYICSSCGTVVSEKSDKCSKCGEHFEGTVDEDKLFHLEVKNEEEDETKQAMNIFRMMAGASTFDTSYIEGLKKDIKESPFPAKVHDILTVMAYYSKKYEEINKSIDNLIKSMKKEKKEDILNHLDDLRKLEDERRKIYERGIEIQTEFSNVLEAYREFIKKKEVLLKGRIDEFQKEVERRKIQARMLVEKEKDLIEREHKLREREKQLEEQLKNVEENTKKLESEEITKEEWLEQQRKIQEKLYQIREEVIKRPPEDEKYTLTKKVLKILDDLLGKLPDEVIDEFARSENFDLYKKVMEMYGLGGGSGAS